MGDVAMPRLSDSMEEGTILKWLKSDGDEVSKGEELVEIETDKANMTYEADESGTLKIVARRRHAAGRRDDCRGSVGRRRSSDDDEAEDEPDQRREDDPPRSTMEPDDDEDESDWDGRRGQGRGLDDAGR